MGRILVTGGAGFIGQNLCRKLLETGHEVTCIDNLSTSRPNVVAELARDHPLRFDFFKVDVENLDALRKIIKNKGLYQIYHLACPASPPHYQKDPVKTMMTCVVGTRNMLEIARETDTRILFTSTSEVYGDPQVPIQAENYRGNVNCTGPRACYDEGKRAAESLCFDYNRKHNVDVRVVRIFNTYGPGMDPDDGRVVSNFIMQALRGEDITIYGDGTQTRSFCYVEDQVRGLMAMMKQDQFIGPVNIGNLHEITIKLLLLAVKRLTNTNSGVVNLPLPEDDPLRRHPDIRLAREKLKWEPLVDLEDGLYNTIGYFKKFI